MKSPFKLIILLLLVTTLPLAAIGSAKLVDKEKEVEHTYDLGAGDKVSLDNQFGDIEIQYWSNKEVKIYAKIKASASNDDKAMKILDAIEVSHSKSGNTVYVDTEIGSKLTKGNKKKDNYKNEFSIDYTIQMPAGNELEVKNSFGDIYLDDHTGELDIDLQFGDLEAGDISNLSELDLQFGSADIDRINGGDIDVQFSSITIDQAEGELDCNLAFCKKSSIGISTSIEDINMRVEHSTLDVELPTNLSATFDISTSFGKLRNDSDYDIKDTTEKSKYGPNFDHEYEGEFGSGDIRIRVKSSFSTIILE